MADDIALPGIDATPILPAPAGNVTQSVQGEEMAGEKPDDADDTPDESDKEVVLRARERWEYVESTDSQNRANQIDDTKFAWEKGAQWNNENRRQREQARPPRPWLEFNQTGPFVKRIVNDQRKNQPAIKVRPAGGGSTKKLADIMSGLIRAIEYDSQASAAYDTGLENAVTGGRGYWRIVTEYEAEDSFNQVVKIKSVPNAMAVYLDPDAQEPDKSDARYAFVCEWIDKETYEREWPAAGDAVSWDSTTDSEWASWFNADKVCVADYYEKVDEEVELVMLDDQRVMWRDQYDKMVASMMAQMPPPMMMMGGMGAPPPPLPPQIMRSETRTRTRVDWYKVTAKPTPLAKYEWSGMYIPVVCCVGDEITIDGKRIYQGVIRRLRDAQMMYNYAYTMMVERVALAPRAPYVGLSGQFEGHAEWDTLNTENHPYLEFEAVQLIDGQMVANKPERTEPIGVDAGLVTILQLCSQNLRDITGQKDSERPDPNTPWRALVQAQRQGDLATYHYGDNEARAIMLTGRILVDLIPNIYDTQRAIRVLEIDGTDKQETINQQMPHPANPAANVTLNDIRVGKYDVTVETGPAYATRRIEATSEMNEFMQTMGPQVAPLIGDIFAKMADWPGDIGDRVSARLHAMLPPQILQAEQDSSQDPQVQGLTAQLKQMQGQMQQMQQAAGAEIAKLTQANAELNLKVQNKTMEFATKIYEQSTKQQDMMQTRAAQAENSESDEYIAKLNAVVKLVEIMATKMGMDSSAATASATGQVNAATQGVGAPDFGNLQNMLAQGQMGADQRMTAALSSIQAPQPQQGPAQPQPQAPAQGMAQGPPMQGPPNGGE
jgi:hypothetical protein